VSVKTFTKSQLAAIIATAIDFLCLVVLVELLNVWYVTATAIAALCGAISHFSLGRWWSFKDSDTSWRKQASRYTLVSISSLVLNTIGVYLLTEGLALQYLLSKIIIAIVIAVGFNYPLHRYYVFTHHSAPR